MWHSVLLRVHLTQSKLNGAQLVSNHQGDVIVPIFDWQTFFRTAKFTNIPGILSQRHFTLPSMVPGVVTVSESSNGNVTTHTIMDPTKFETGVLPNVVVPKGLSGEVCGAFCTIQNRLTTT